MKTVKLNVMRLGSSFVAVLILGLLPVPVLAETVVRTGDSISIGVNQIVENNLYAAGGSVSISGEVKADMYAAAGSVTVNGPIGADFTAIGGTIQTHAKVADDVRVIGGDVVIANEVGGDVFVFGGQLKVLSSAKVAGNVYFYGGEAEIDGEVAGSIMGQADTFFIRNSVGAVDVSARKIVLSDNANVAGNLSYKNGGDLERSLNSTVSGEILVIENGLNQNSRSNFPLMFFLAWLFTSLSMLWLFRPQLEKLLVSVKKSPARVGIIGLSGLVAAPVLATILITTVLGIWVGIAILLLFLFFCLAALVLLPILLGSYLLSLYRKNDRVDILSVILGVATIGLLSLVPFLGGLFVFAIFVITFGALLQRVYRTFRSAV